MVPPYFSRDFKADVLPKFLKCDLYIDRVPTFFSGNVAGSASAKSLHTLMRLDKLD